VILLSIKLLKIINKFIGLKREGTKIVRKIVNFVLIEINKFNKLSVMVYNPRYRALLITVINNII